MKKLAIFGFVAGALALRVLPAWSNVFTLQGVGFQEFDAWYHVRTVHNLLAHFPHRSAFDPYAFFPGGEKVPTGPLWDYMIATTAWVLGFGAPSPAFVEAVAAWLPAILGALFPIPAFFLARCLFDDRAGIFAALWTAFACGGFLWITHLGLADHHAAEAFFAFLTLTLLCTALERGPGREALLLAIAGGCAMGAFLAVRPAGVFIPAILACATVIEPLAAPVVLAAVLAAAVVFLPAAGSLWAQYTWLSLGAAGAAAAGALVLSRFTRRREWFLAAAAGAMLVAGLARPRLLGSLWFEVKRVAGYTRASRIVASVQEMQPIYHVGRHSGLASILEQLGVVWIVAPLFLLWAVFHLRRKRRPALLLFTMWSTVAAVATVMEARMLIYFVPVAAVMAGAACARIKPRIPAVAAAGIAIGINLLGGIPALMFDQAPGSDFRAAMAWLSRNSPEPFHDPGAWSRYYAKRDPGMPAGWGVAVWWDNGYEVEELAHRIPMSNGTQFGAEDMARFFTSDSPESAIRRLRDSGGRYVLVSPDSLMFGGIHNSFFLSQLGTLGHPFTDYFQVLHQKGDAGQEQLVVYLPKYYRSMAARLYLTDGAAVKGRGDVLLLEVDPANLVLWTKRYDSEQEAANYMEKNPGHGFIMGCPDYTVSCVDLPALAGVRPVFSSDPAPVSSSNLRAVKIFEVVGEQPLP